MKPPTLADEVAEALRECEAFAKMITLARQAPSSEYNALLAAITRYGDLREKAGREEGESWWRAAVEKWASVHFGSVEATAIQEYTGKYGGTPSMMLQSIVAAARLAGRLEQAEKAANLCGNSRAHSDVWAALKDERDRLRREVEEAKHESS